jgi:hypothetical protein
MARDKRISLDLETIDSGSHAAIVSIGAVYFDLDDGLGATFYCPVNGAAAVEQYNRTYSDATLGWWAKQSEEAKKVLTDPHALDLKDALLAFKLFAGDHDTTMINPQMWGNGADFDCVILGNSYEAVGIKKPWSYSQNRCLRTMKNEVKLGPGEGPTRRGTHHNALDDAIYQAELAIALLRKIR